jgi:hypothetical protein
MKTEIPNALKADVPQTKWGKLLLATPVVMTVIATLLAGLASSEMTRAQYDRSLAAQQQSKAGDQWNFFQAKRLRGAMQRSTLDVLQSTTELRPLDTGVLARFISAPDPLAAAALQQGELPAVPAAQMLEANVKAALDAVENQKPEAEIVSLLQQVKDAPLAEAVAAARDRSRAFDDATKPINQAIDQWGISLPAADKPLSRDFTAARLRYAALRYDAEARLNQAIANLYELQVRKNNISAERHHTRSQRFFYGMLAAQMAVIIATFAIAARKRNLLWSLAAAAGMAAISFAIYVYLYV